MCRLAGPVLHLAVCTSLQVYTLSSPPVEVCFTPMCIWSVVSAQIIPQTVVRFDLVCGVLCYLPDQLVSVVISVVIFFFNSR
mmetsp:Transcript_15964/g.40931  ORF Transcript_15964/g.40931 Transcript_15964/m.40931 type:complete len:82 (+) Transcript_15964:552-797(+)